LRLASLSVAENVEFSCTENMEYCHIVFGFGNYVVEFLGAESGFGDNEAGDGGLEGVGLLTPRNLFASMIYWDGEFGRREIFLWEC